MNECEKAKYITTSTTAILFFKIKNTGEAFVK